MTSPPAIQSPRWSRAAAVIASPAPLVLISVPALVYLLFVYRFALNVPLGDDVTDVLRVLIAVVDASEPAEAWQALYAQHNDHRTLASRLLYLLVYAIQGEIDFRLLTALASGGLLLLIYLYYRSLGDSPVRYCAALVAAFLLLQPRAYGITLWPMAAFAYHFVYVYAFAAILCLHRDGPGSFIAALVFATLSTYSLASGQLIWLVGLVGLLQQALLRRRSYWYVLAWACCAVLVAIAWRWGLETPNSAMAVLQQFFLTPAHHAGFFLTLAGAAIGEDSLPLAMAAGIVLTVVPLLALLRRFRCADVRLELFAIFILLSIFVVTLGRAPYAAMDYSLAARYAFPSVLLACTCVVLLLCRFLRFGVKSALPVLLLSASYCLLGWLTWPQALQPYYDKRIERYNAGSYWVFGTPGKESRAIVERAVELEIYAPPPRPLVRRELEW